MISALTGELRHVNEDRVHLQVGPLLCELLVPASDVPLLQAGVGEEMTFHTVFYIEGDASGGNLTPRLLGFLRSEDKRFFEKFITVKGIGPKKALKALIFPAGEIAHAIESKDAKFLKQLPQIGARMAEQIVAELAGKVGEFATVSMNERAGLGLPPSRSSVEEDAIAALLALGERRVDAERLLERATAQAEGKLKTTNDFVREMLRMRTVRST
jgi:Holliday junction DNA helicase RuvA